MYECALLLPFFCSLKERHSDMFTNKSNNTSVMQQWSFLCQVICGTAECTRTGLTVGVSNCITKWHITFLRLIHGLCSICVKHSRVMIPLISCATYFRAYDKAIDSYQPAQCDSMPFKTPSLKMSLLHVMYSLQLLLLPIFTLFILWIMSKQEQLISILCYCFEIRSLTEPASLFVFLFYSAILHKTNGYCHILQIQFLRNSKPTTESVLGR